MKIVSISISKKKGTRKFQISKARAKKDHGLENDAHAGPWHRQVSFLSAENIDHVRRVQGLDVSYGDFAENIATSGITWERLPVGTRVRLGDSAVMEITQIGKTCHNKCAVYHQAGDCIMPRKGVFARVVKGGVIRVGDGIEIL